MKPFQFDPIVPPVLPARKRARTAEEENSINSTHSTQPDVTRAQITPAPASTVVSVLTTNNNNDDNNVEEDEDAADNNKKAEEKEQQEEEGGGGGGPADEMILSQESLVVCVSTPTSITPSVSALIPTPSIVPPHTITAASFAPPTAAAARKPAAAAATARAGAVPSARPESSIRGHTSFLTFARRIVL